MIFKRYKTLPRRILAGIIDAIPFIMIAVVLGNYHDGQDLRWYLQTLIGGSIWQTYSVSMNVKFGGTLGKMAMGIRVMDIGEDRWPSLRQALIRDSVWIASFAIGAVLMSVKLIHGESLDPMNSNLVEDVTNWAGMAWFGVEIVTSLFSDKRRAVHDWMANTVAVNYKESLVSPNPDCADVIQGA